jgi:glucokinase
MASHGSIGIDIGGSKTLLALLDANMKPLEEIKTKSHGEDKKRFTDTLKDSVHTLLKRATEHGVLVSAVGVGCAGTIDTARNMVRVSPNLPALNGYSFGRALRDITNSTIHVYNDVNAALYGELKCGAAKGCAHVIGVFLGTGVGAAVAIDGKLHTGATGHAGNIGHFLDHPYGMALDSVASRTAITAEAAALAARNRAPHLLKSAGSDVRRIKSNEFAKAIRKGDKSIEDLIASRMHILGIALAKIVDLLNPEMILLGGGLTNAMPALIRAEVTAGIKAHASMEGFRNLRVVTSKLKNHAVTVGAAKLVLDEEQG